LVAAAKGSLDVEEGILVVVCTVANRAVEEDILNRVVVVGTIVVMVVDNCLQVVVA